MLSQLTPLLITSDLYERTKRLHNKESTKVSHLLKEPSEKSDLNFGWRTHIYVRNSTLRI